ncbi:uncharacterized protein SPPG_06015 [Spizellomyces punctatus DAOM BR117]|uniref:Uncharacterized protein n=1 Tax=Spizellomyces punctatus (strain DAOM BR117) TaxID=645134 RepID=A0A0L0HDK6_SPIPD|nr:uncharacterized protein SPPG_06015 [Spizellomyces punctatus DAOM BR117]KNC99066.1 hypothetical protein SPPG_06015 [Spizellomyces punctatus DAOM BR117]|eukprot:XP_016607106.1 hypothetical protein SPPG_06015 [Spizellomyces punctatus DAOM BR117]
MPTNLDIPPARYGHELYTLTPHTPDTIQSQCKKITTHIQSTAIPTGILVGRGVNEHLRWYTPHTPSTVVEFGVLYIPCDVFGGAFSSPPSQQSTLHNDIPLHIWGSITHPTLLTHLPTTSFHSLLFDYSTWRYMTLSPTVLKHWHTILVEEGWIGFDAYVASVRAGNEVGYEWENPTHLVLPCEDVKVFIKKRGLLVNQRQIVSAPLKGHEQMDRHPYLDTLKELYERVFVGSGLFDKVVLRRDAYPVQTRGHIGVWFQVFKKKSGLQT